MKRTLLTFLFPVLFSCDQVHIVKFAIANNTQKKISIHSFYNHEKLDKIEIKPLSYFEKKGDLAGNNVDLYLFDKKYYGGIRDSIVIIWDDSVYKVQFCENKKPVNLCDSIENNLGSGMGLPNPGFGYKKGLFKVSYKYPQNIVFFETYFKDALPLNK
jgi:hypothetical protein